MMDEGWSEPDQGLAGEVALVTGGSRGIGLAIARKLVEHGSAVALVLRDMTQLNDATSALSTVGNRVLPLVGDVTDPRSMETAVKQVTQWMGGLSILISNPGVGKYAPVAEQPLDEWREVLESNLLGAFYST